MSIHVVLTDHAYSRCRSRKINPYRIIKECAQLPPFTGELEWTFPGGVTATMASHRGVICVITVYRKKRRGRKRERV